MHLAPELGGELGITVADNGGRDAVMADYFGNKYFRELDRKSTRLNSSHSGESRMPSSA